MSVNSIAAYSASGVPAQASSPPQTAQTAAASPAPKTDVIDLSKPPTPEQAERLRNMGILGYGTIRGTASGGSISSGTHFSVNYSFEYFDVVNETVIRHASTTSGVFTENGFSAVSESLTVQTTFDEDRYLRGQLGDVAGKMAAARQVKESYLDEHFSGKERDSRLARLDESYQSAKREAVDSFARMLVKFLKPDDRGGFEQDVRGSVQAVFSQYEEKYRSAAAGQAFNAWAKASFHESVINLQKLSASVRADANRGAWQLEELDFAAVSISAYHSALSAVQKGGSEARYALNFSMTSMKVEVMASHGRIHNNLANMLLLSGQNAQKGGVFSAVADRVMERFHSSGDALDAIRAGAGRGGIQPGMKGYQSTFEAEWRGFTMELNSRAGGFSLMG